MYPEFRFPDPELADEDGLLAVGGKLETGLVKQAYSMGIFPWYNAGQPVLWWSPDPRFVLFPGKFRLSKSLRACIRRGSYRFAINTAFRDVIRACRHIPRKGQEGSWITDEMEDVYNSLHEEGLAYSFECFCHDQLVGGLYGIMLGRVFCGESMFSKLPDASKFAFAASIPVLEEKGIELIDCQTYTAHLESLGAEMIPRKEFLSYLV